MTTPPPITGRGEHDALVVRTDFHDDAAWVTVKTLLTAPWGVDAFDACLHIVDDAAFDGAATADVLAAASADEGLDVLFIADRATMLAGHHALTAATTVTRDRLDDDEWYEELVRFGAEFRTLPVGVNDIHANLSIADMDFQEFAEAARADPEGVYRSF